jgi:hypothetical protein
MKPMRTITITFIASLLLLSMLLPVSAANTFSYSYKDSPLMTPEMEELIAEHNAATVDDNVLVIIYSSFASMWVDGHSWKEIVAAVHETEPRTRYLAVEDVGSVKFYRFTCAGALASNKRDAIAKRLFAMKDGYRYDGKTYDIEMIYWLDALSENTGGGYAAIVTTEGTFFEHYNQIYLEKENPEVLVFTEEEFAQWYPEFVRPMVERNRYNYERGYLGESTDSEGDFADFLAANGFTPRYGEAQGVTRRVLTYGGIGLASVAFVGGITYATVRHRRKRKAAAEGDEIL